MKLTTKETVLFGILGGTVFGLKVCMMMLPNIEPVTLMVILFAVTFGKKAIYPIYVYVALELLFYGANIWVINYFYIWPLLAIIAWQLRKMESSLGWAVLSGIFGLLFGLLCAPVYAVIGGVSFTVSWWISGIPYDIIHCVSSFAITLLLFKPSKRLLNRLISQNK